MTAGPLPRSAPSAQGVDAGGILSFLDAVDSAGFDLHSLMVLRHGHVVAEGWWAPYRADGIHLLYSVSKSFTSTAVGIAIAEGLLDLDDPVVGFFPDKAPADVPPRLARMTVSHLLAMASGHAVDTLPTLAASGERAVAGFLSVPQDEEPGSLFCYNQGCTYTLSAIITTLTGERLVDYLRPRLFEPLGIDQAYWTQTKEGFDQGFSGLHVTTETVAKLGQLHLRDGEWDGRQVLPAGYARAAHAKQIDNSQLGEIDWRQGYGYQFWVCRHGAFRGDGAFGQFCVVMPDADAVVACTAQVLEMQAELDLIWEHLLPAVSGSGRADADGDAEERLAERLASLSTPVVDAGGDGPGRPVSFERVGEPVRYTAGLGGISVEPVGEATRLSVTVDGSPEVFDLRPGLWTEGELPVFRPLPAVAVSGGWTAPDEFSADVVSLTSPHRLRLRGSAGGKPTVAVDWVTTPL